MGTLTVATVISNVRSDLNETTTTILSDAELTILINDAYKDVAVKGLCYESAISKTTVAGNKIIDLHTAADIASLIFPIRVNNVTYHATSTVGLMAVLPQTIGYMPCAYTNETTKVGVPQYWFQWGDKLYIEPSPADAYALTIYAACYPTAVRVASSADINAGNVPVEFHECIYLFTLAYAALKLRRWGDAANAYNKYIMSVQQKRAEYIMKYPDYRSSHELPDNVTMQQEQRGG